jgi:acyl-CoA synthetase (AMP-forming)/AMP-acid ligase II
MSAQASAVDYPFQVMGERVRAVVTRRGESAPTLEDILACLEVRSVAEFRFSQRFDVVAAVQRNAAGKVLKSQLRRETQS